MAEELEKQNKVKKQQSYNAERNKLKDIGRKLQEQKLEVCGWFERQNIQKVEPTEAPPFQKFFDLPVEKQIKENDSRISIMSYNVLADLLCTFESFSYVKQEYLNFLYRSKMIVDKISHFDPDIICLQEVDRYGEFYEGQLNRIGYQNIYFKKEGDEKSDGVVIGWKRDKFINTNIHKMIYGDAIPFIYNKKAHIFKKGHGALIVDLQEKNSKKKLVISNTHLYWHPMSEDVKYFQISRLLEHLNRVYKKNDNIIFCGDLNSSPESNIVRHIMDSNQGDITPWSEYITPISERQMREMHGYYFQNARKTFMKFNSAYENYLKIDPYEKEKHQNPNLYDNHPHFTNFTPYFIGLLDYIFYNQEANMSLSKILSLPKISELDYAGGIPNKYEPSDHIPLMAEFILHQ